MELNLILIKEPIAIMNLLKSMFIMPYMMITMGIMCYSGWMLYQGANPVAWVGVLLTTAPLMTMISYLMMLKSVARTSAHFPVINILGISGVGLAAWALYSQNAVSVGMDPLILAVFSWTSFLIYAYWYSSFGRKPSPKLKVGSTLPSFTVKNADDQMVTSQKLTSTPAIMIFYRGNWCPLCVAQIKELVAQYKDISELGVKVALISPQPHKNTIAISKKFGVKFDFLTDQGSVAAKALGISDPHGVPKGMPGYDSETALPTVIITDANGKIIWTHETDNYRVRPEPDMYLEVLRKNNIVVAAA